MMKGKADGNLPESFGLRRMLWRIAAGYFFFLFKERLCHPSRIIYACVKLCDIETLLQVFKFHVSCAHFSAFRSRSQFAGTTNMGGKKVEKTQKWDKAVYALHVVVCRGSVLAVMKKGPNPTRPPLNKHSKCTQTSSSNRGVMLLCPNSFVVGKETRKSTLGMHNGFGWRAEWFRIVNRNC